MSNRSYTILNRPTKEGYSIFYSRIMDFAPDKYVTTEQYKLVDMLILLEYFTNGIRPGLVVVIDMQGTTLGHLARINILTVKKFLYYVQVRGGSGALKNILIDTRHLILFRFAQEALPVRLKKVIIMNALPIVDKFLTVFKPFMKKSLLDMVALRYFFERQQFSRDFILFIRCPFIKTWNLCTSTFRRSASRRNSAETAVL